MPEPSLHPETLLVRCPNWVGDVIMAIPVFDCLRTNFPAARIVGIAKPNQQGILRDGPWCDAFIDLRDKSWAGFWQMVREIRALHPAFAVVLPNSLRSALSLKLAGVHRIYGYRRDLRSPLLTGGPRPLKEGGRIVPLPMQDYYLEICRWLGLKLPEKPKPRLFIGRGVKERGDRLLASHGVTDAHTVIGINPGASFGSSKCWLPEYFARTAEHFAQDPRTKVLIFSGPGEEEIVRKILAHSRAPLINAGPDRVDLELLKPLIQRCDLLITNDTGPRHYAVALDVPVVVIMGPTDPRYTARHLEKTVVLRPELPCSPCHLKVCPIHHPCMNEITPDMVIAAGETLLNPKGLP